MNLTNEELLQELEKRILTQKITLESQPDTIKQCGWSEWKPNFLLKSDDYALNLSKLFSQLETQKN